jgi:histidinol phosphate phosphatase hisN-like protein
VSVQRNDQAERNPWRPARYDRQELADALLQGRIAGTVTSHDRHNVRWKVARLVEGDPDLQFGLTGLQGPTAREVLAMVGDEAGFDADPLLRDDPVPIDPWKVLASLEAAGRRLALAAERGERVIAATGHPVGLILLYMSVGELLLERGAKLLRPLEAVPWREDGKRREIRYLHGIAVLNDRASSIHTHRPDAMERMLEEVRPDLVFADHGFAGAAIEAGVETVSIADINDPALVVAKHQGRTEVVVVMDDNVRPEDYWPCFQAIASQFDVD